jgi:outer membrane protein assembly factor BamA
LNYTYLKQEKRNSWLWSAGQVQIPLHYQYYDMVKRFPKQAMLSYTWMKETSFGLQVNHPLNKFNRFELFSKLSHRSFNVFGYKVDEFDERIFSLYPDDFNTEDLQMFRFVKGSNGSNLSFGTAYVRDTVLFSGNTWGPFHGNAFRAQVEFAPPMGNEFQGFTSVYLAGRMYRHLGSSSLIATRCDAKASSKANGDFMLLGGPEFVRGIQYGSIAGNQVGYCSGEIRFPVPGTYILGTPVRAFLFSDLAYARFSDERFSEQKIKVYGFGIQYFIPIIGLPGQTIGTIDNGKVKTTFYVSMNW